MIRFMFTAESILHGAEFTGGFDPRGFAPIPEIGFLARQEQEGVLAILGFGANLVMCHRSTADTVVPVVDFAELPRHLQTIEAQGKGVGPRLYNSKEGPASLRRLPEEVGIYTLTIARDTLFDAIPSQGTPRQRLAEQFRKLVSARVRGAGRVVDNVHEQYGDASVVLLETPPQALGRLKLRGLYPDGFNSRFLIVRKPHIMLHKIGESVVRSR